jgi:Ser/Thr protein kinase RdoA (MazF antagonist)
MGSLDASVPHFTTRVAEAQRVVADHRLSPELADGDRNLLDHVLRSLTETIRSRGPDEQALHGEPHPGNLLHTEAGPLFIDLETCCRGPVEFDIAHAPDDVAAHYPGVDRDLLRACRILTLALATTWRWERADQLPNGRALAFEWLAQIRDALERGSGATPPSSRPRAGG